MEKMDWRVSFVFPQHLFFTSSFALFFQCYERSKKFSNFLDAGHFIDTKCGKASRRNLNAQATLTKKNNRQECFDAH